MPASRDGFLNKKQELFCRFVARGENYTTAYELAGYAPSTSNASTLASRPDIKKRIEELRDEHLRDQAKYDALLANAKRESIEAGDPSILDKQVEWTVHRVLDMIAENVKLAQIAGSFGAANDALKMLGDAMGMFNSAKQAAAPSNPLTLIGKAVAQLGSSAEEVPMKSANPLAPQG